MQTFPLGSFNVGRVGYGAMQLPGPGVFGPPRDHDEALAVLRRAIELGINHIDTSQFYGPNVANQLIREALHPYPADLALVSKVGARRDDTGAWLPAQEPDELRADIEENLETLGTDRLAAVNLRVHDEATDPNSPAQVNRELFDRQLTAMIKARDEGLIGGIGLSSIVPEHLRIALDRTEIVTRSERLQPRRPDVAAGAGRLHRARHLVRAVLSARFGFRRRQPRARPSRRQERGDETRAHTGADRTRVDAVRRAECAADPRHVIGGASRGEHRRPPTSSSTTTPNDSSTPPPDFRGNR